MVVIVEERRRGGFGVGMMEGAMIGGMMAHRREERREEQMMLEADMLAEQAAIRNANANAELARAEAEALRQQQYAAQAVPAARLGLVAVNVVVPAGISHGMPFNVESGGRVYSVTCPAGVFPGQLLRVELPAPTPPVVATAYAL